MSRQKVIGGLLAVASAAFASLAPPAGAWVLPDFGPDAHWVSAGHVEPWTPAQTLANLELLKNAGATGIVTYTSAATSTEVQVAAELGLKVILGVYNPTDITEDNAAGQTWAAYPTTVVGINVGNEGLCTGLYTFPQLERAVRAFEQDTTAAITTSENWYEFDAAITGNQQDLNYCHGAPQPGLLSLGDFLSANIYSYQGLENQNDSTGPCQVIDSPSANAQWTYNEMQYIHGHTLLPVFLHETGYPADQGYNPSGGGCSGQRQAAYYCALRGFTTAFSHFDGFDDADGQDYLGKWGGIFSLAGQAKPAATELTSC